jgi:hypothetical protein
LLLCYFINTSGQTVIFSEDFSGFTQGNHANPYTNEVTSELDLRTHLSGWTGAKVYSAGGEIKLGTSDIIGWIETPLISFSGIEGSLILKFDICRYSNDATSIKVLLNSQQIGNSISPAEDFQTVEIPLTPGIPSGKIKFEAISKRFYLDNLLIVAGSITSTDNSADEAEDVVIFPNPAGDFASIRNSYGYKILEISDISGRRYATRIVTGDETIEICLSDFPAGMYIVRLSSGKKLFTGRLIKL